MMEVLLPTRELRPQLPSFLESCLGAMEPPEDTLHRALFLDLTTDAGGEGLLWLSLGQVSPDLQSADWTTIPTVTV